MEFGLNISFYRLYCFDEKTLWHDFFIKNMTIIMINNKHNELDTDKKIKNGLLFKKLEIILLFVSSSIILY